MTMLLLPLLIVAGLATAGQATTPAAPAAAPAPGSATAPHADPNYTYTADGRRDPFVSLLKGGSDSRAMRPAGGAEGVAGLAVDELSVRGVVAAPGGLLAMVQGPDNKTYIVRANDHLLDGTVKTVTKQGLVIMQEVSDPLSLVKQKEVHKMLRGLEEGK